MIGEVIARRYAQALFNAARDADVVENIFGELSSIAELMAVQREFQYFMLTPRIEKKRKIQVFQDTFGDRFHPITMKFLSLIIEKQRQEFLKKIFYYYKILYNIYFRQVEATAKSALPLSEKEEQEINDLINRITEKKALLTTKTDPSIIGGIIIQIGNTIFDSSVRGQLKDMHQSLLK